MEKRWDLMENFGVSLSPLWECRAVGGLVVLVQFFLVLFFMPATFLFLCLRFLDPFFPDTQTGKQYDAQNSRLETF